MMMMEGRDYHYGRSQLLDLCGPSIIKLNCKLLCHSISFWRALVVLARAGARAGELSPLLPELANQSAGRSALISTI